MPFMRKIKTHADNDNSVYDVVKGNEGGGGKNKYPRTEIDKEQRSNANSMRQDILESMPPAKKKTLIQKQIESAKKNKPKGFIYK